MQQRQTVRGIRPHHRRPWPSSHEEAGTKEVAAAAAPAQLDRGGWAAGRELRVRRAAALGGDGRVVHSSMYFLAVLEQVRGQTPKWVFLGLKWVCLVFDFAADGEIATAHRRLALQLQLGTPG